MSRKASAEIRMKGLPISEGIAIGLPVFLFSENQESPNFPISLGEVEDEIVRYRQALTSSREELTKLQGSLMEEGSQEGASIIGSHIEMLDDPLMTTEVEAKIREMLKNTEFVFNTVMDDYGKKFCETPKGKERLADVQDLSQRILRTLSGSRESSFDEVPQNGVVFIKELIPSAIASANTSRIAAFVTESGGSTSHAAVIARTKGIPCIHLANISGLVEKVQNDCVIVDGEAGEVILNPSPETIQHYLEAKARLKKRYKQLDKQRDFPSETIDGYHVELSANINDLADLELAQYHRCATVGLFRSEYLFLSDYSLFFDEKRQIELYTAIFEQLKGMQLTFRLMDLGGDKHADCFDETANPDCRGIRFLLLREDLLKIQLRALLQAGFQHHVQVLLPLITEVRELRRVKQIIRQVELELKSAAVPFLEKIPIGCMLESPSAILITDVLARESDFLSMGTNDLTEALLGVNRGNPDASSFYSTHPGIVRMIRMALLEAKRSDKKVTLCGEMASNPLFIPLLIGLGINHFSCSPRAIPIVKRTIRQVSLLDALDVAEHVLTLQTSAEIAKYLSEEMSKIDPETPHHTTVSSQSLRVQLQQSEE